MVVLEYVGVTLIGVEMCHLLIDIDLRKLSG